MKKIIHKLHLWLSVPVGLIITIICFTGAVLVFETEIKDWCNSSLYYAQEIKDKPIAIDELFEKVNRQLPDSMQVSSISIPADPERNYSFGISGRHRAFVYVNPYTAEIVGNSGDAVMGDFFMTMMRLHRWLLDEFKRDGSISVGKMIVGICTLVFVFILVTGIIIWIPKTARALRRSLKINVKKGWKRFWYDLHIAGGVYAVLLLLVLALTGLTWSFSWYRSGFYALFGVEMQQPQRPQQATQVNAERIPGDARGQRTENKQGERLADPVGRENRQGGERPAGNGMGERVRKQKINTSNWAKVAGYLTTNSEPYKSISIQDGKATVSLDKSVGNTRAADSYTFNAETGEITDVKLYRNQGNSSKIRGWIYSVHVGSWGGVVTKILAFLASLLGATLPITGYYIWIKKYISKRKAKRNRL